MAVLEHPRVAGVDHLGDDLHHPVGEVRGEQVVDGELAPLGEVAEVVDALLGHAVARPGPHAEHVAVVADAEHGVGDDGEERVEDRVRRGVEVADPGHEAVVGGGRGRARAWAVPGRARRARRLLLPRSARTLRSSPAPFRAGAVAATTAARREVWSRRRRSTSRSAGGPAAGARRGAARHGRGQGVAVAGAVVEPGVVVVAPPEAVGHSACTAPRCTPGSPACASSGPNLPSTT